VTEVLIGGSGVLVIGYWLLVIGYWLLVIGYWLLVFQARVGKKGRLISPITNSQPETHQ
jgi:TM2 domain-containing membrane protein YozV